MVTDIVSIVTSYLLLLCFASHTERVHHKLSKEQLAQVFGVTNHNETPIYALISLGLPKVCTYNISDDHPHSLAFQAFGLSFNLSLRWNDNLLPKSHTIEFHYENGTVEKQHGLRGEFSRGFVRGDNGSHVALHHTPFGTSGSIRTSNDFFIISPLPDGLKDRQYDHVMYPGNNVSVRLQQFSAYQSDDYPTMNRRSSSKPVKTVELLLASDYKMVEFYTKEFLPTYMLTVGNIMAGIFHDSTLTYPLDVVIVRTVIFETNRFKATSIGDLLSKFSDWIQENNDPDDKNPLHADNAILLTRSGCDDGCHLEGLALSSKPCNVRDQGVVKDRGMMTAITACHELAHTFGAAHDGLTADCPDGNYVMSSGSSAGSNVMQWSTCSSEYLSKTLTESSVCFDDHPISHLSNSSFQTYGTVYNADMQCKFIYGEKFGRCEPYQHRCDRLFCRNRDTAKKCTALVYPPLHGTYCAPNKWCIFGNCVPDGTKMPPPVDGMWSSWGDFTMCNQLCGVGLQWRTRECNNPKPDRGKKCVGSEKGQYKTCNTEPCVHKEESYRSLQCQNINVAYRYFFEADDPCVLICGNSEHAYYYGNVADGTKCYPNTKSNDVCIEGKCKTVGCDLALESHTVLDRCGVCNGNGTECRLVNGTDLNKYPIHGLYHLVNIPAYAFDIVIRELGETANFIGFAVEDEKQLAFRVPAYSTNYNLEGTIVEYIMEDLKYPDILRIQGKIIVPIRIYLVNVYQVPSSGIAWGYYEPSAIPQPAPGFTWKEGKWSTCSSTCAGGMQYRLVACIRVDDNTTVDRKSCSSIQRPESEQECNVQDCPPQWHITNWGTCSKSCGKGVHTRELFCIKLTTNGIQRVSDHVCISQKPDMVIKKFCNEIMCHAEWHIDGNFGPCSRSCGGGMMSRRISCQRLNGDGTITRTKDLECHLLEKPDSFETCNEDIACPLWKISYAPCSVTCGEGTQTPQVGCADPSSPSKFVDSSKCNPSTKPPRSKILPKKCNAGLCEEFEWIEVEGICSVTCGQGVIPIHAKCQEKNMKIPVDDRKCIETKPSPSSKKCDAGDCPEVYLWRIRFSRCTKTCGGGLQHSQPFCIQKSNGAIVENIYCDASEEPEIKSKACGITACPIKYILVVVYEKCSVTCSKGIQTAKLLCKRDKDMEIVEDTLCDSATRPVLIDKPCDMGDCPPVYKWVAYYLPCDVTCGKGSQQQQLTCIRQNDGAEMSPSYCESLERPVLKLKSCHLEACPYPYLWNVTYGPCAADCNNGVKIMVMDCLSRETKMKVESSKCPTDFSPSNESCILNPCKADFKLNDNLVFHLGCFKDFTEHRVVPHYLRSFREIIDYKNTSNIVMNCTLAALRNKFEFFAIQYFGECWAGDSSTAITYYLGGEGSHCFKHVGNTLESNIYHFDTPLVTEYIPPLVNEGFLSDGGNKDSIIMKTIQDYSFVKKCSLYAFREKRRVFAVKENGDCVRCKTSRELKTSLQGAESINLCLLPNNFNYYVFRLLSV